MFERTETLFATQVDRGGGARVGPVGRPAMVS